MNKHVINRKKNCLARSILLLVMVMCTHAALAQEYISELYVYAGGKLTGSSYNGYNLFQYGIGNADLNKDAKGEFAYLGYKKTSKPEDAITDVVVYDAGSNGSCPGSSIIVKDKKYYLVANNGQNYGNLNRGAKLSSNNLYMYYQRR